MKKNQSLIIYIFLLNLIAVGTFAQSTVTWINLDGVIIDQNNDLVRSRTGWGWNSGAASQEVLAAGQDGAVQAVVSELNLSRMLGLSERDGGNDLNSIDFGVILHEHGRLEVFEKGAHRINFNPIATGGIVRIERVNNEIRYLYDGTVFYTSLITSETKLIVDISMHNFGTTLTAVTTENFGDGTTQLNSLKVNTDKLPAGFKAAIAGKLICEAMKVQYKAEWPDYVFEEGYPLKTLPEVEAHIKKYGHLPNTPSAKVLEANGIKMEEVNRLLMEKIEELTLYLIESNKKLAAQQKDIDALKQKIEGTDK
ncbi:MAG: hypothetical protein ACPGJS_02020 [Flammeovirgaceae bacterium]